MEIIRKNIIIFILALVFGSCANETQLDLSSFPTITVEEGSTFQINVGEELAIHLAISASKPLHQLEVYKNGTLIETYQLEHNKSVNHPYTFIGIKEDVNIPLNLTFVAIDEQGTASATSILLYVVETPLAYIYQGANVCNANGPGFSGWNLATNLPTDEDTDIMNTSTASSGWVKGWKSATRTRFVKLSYPPSIGINELTHEDIKAIYASAEIVQSTVDVAAGDYLVAKIDASQQYALIYIEKVDELIDNSSESIVFTYRKTTVYAGS